MPLPMTPYSPPTDPWLEVLYHDDTIIVLNKQAGLLSVPGKTEPDCLETRAQERFADALTIHRLDMATSGVCVMARGKKNLAHIQQQFEKRKTTKRYIALVAGSMNNENGTVNAPIVCDWPNRPLQKICTETGRQAITHWHVLDRTGDTTRLALTPITGRSHQLRLHLKIIGHPILGDEWYADEVIKLAAPRLCLHAENLGFSHPLTGEWETYHAETPF